MMRKPALALMAALSATLIVVTITFAQATPSLVTVGSPAGSTPQNHQNEPAVAVDAAHPNVLAAGVNDFIDWRPCPPNDATQRGTCFDPADDPVGLSGVYFSFDSGHSWVQPT